MKRFVKKYRTKARILKYNPWNQDAEPGDIMIGEGKLFRLEESHGWGRRTAGELYCREIKPPAPNLGNKLLHSPTLHPSVTDNTRNQVSGKAADRGFLGELMAVLTC